MEKVAVQFAQRQITIATRYGERTVNAKATADLAVHPTPGCESWTVTHVPTGTRIYLAGSEREAIDIAALVELEHTDFLRATRRMRFATRAGAARRLRGKNKEAADRLRNALAKARGDLA